MYDAKRAQMLVQPSSGGSGSRNEKRRRHSMLNASHSQSKFNFNSYSYKICLYRLATTWEKKWKTEGW
jgi:hypothetical protein